MKIAVPVSAVERGWGVQAIHHLVFRRSEYPPGRRRRSGTETNFKRNPAA